MNHVGLAIRELYHAEYDLARELLVVAERHREDHDIFHVARDLAGWSQRHIDRLTDMARDRGITLEPPPEPSRGSAVGTTEPAGHGDDPRLRLLSDLRGLHRMAAGVSLDWEILAQTAQALKDPDLLTLAQRCHPATLRQLRWANAALKESAPQIMTIA